MKNKIVSMIRGSALIIISLLVAFNVGAYITAYVLKDHLIETSTMWSIVWVAFIAIMLILVYCRNRVMRHAIQNPLDPPGPLSFVMIIAVSIFLSSRIMLDEYGFVAFLAGTGSIFVVILMLYLFLMRLGDSRFSQKLEFWVRAADHKN